MPIVMAYFDDIWAVIEGANTSTTRDTGGNTRVRDGASFKGLPIIAQNEINDITENELKKRAKMYARKLGQPLDSLKDVKERSAKLVPLILNNFQSKVPLTEKVRDSIYRGVVAGGGGTGGIANPRNMNGVRGQDPNTATYSVPNIWISPYEAASIYSQEGVPQTIINKKSKSILLNGVKIKNPRLDPKQIDLVYEDIIKNGLAESIANSTGSSLIYGGGLLYPMFKKDSPLTMNMPVQALARYGIVRKGCIARWVELDRWNTVHIPNWNPTASDFQYPKKYYIPFAGVDVNGERCARIVTAPQPGYYGVLLTMGWGVSDIPGWIESVYNYYNVMAAIPTMINQMSIIVRTFEVEGPLATEGMNMMDDLDYENTIHVREASMNNPISLDVVGKLQAIQRDFAEVPGLVRLIRQDVGGRANIAEELIWSSERGQFSSGDTTEGALEKLWENNKYIHKDVAHQLRNIVQIEIINALGLDRDVLSALPYTTIEFDNPSLTDAFKKSEFFMNMMKGVFDAAGATVPMDQVMKMAAAIGDTDFPIDSELMEQLKQRQEKRDRQDDEKFEKEIELMEEQIKHMGDAPAGASGGASGGKKGDGYSRLEQHQHEKTRGTGTRKEGLQKAKAKKVGGA
jgi:hypothetical protein